MSSDLDPEVVATADALSAAQAELAACRVAVREAEAALRGYEDRARAGLTTSPSTYGDRRAALDLAQMALTAAEVRADAADEEHKFAVAALAADSIVTDRRLNGAQEPAMHERVADLVAEARQVAEDFYTNRNAALAEVHGRAVAAGLPRASIPPGQADVVVENPLAPVAVWNSGLYIEGRSIQPVAAGKAARDLVIKTANDPAVNR